MDKITKKIKCCNSTGHNFIGCYTGSGCPEIVFMENKKGKFVKILDDFNSEIKMTEDQFNVLKDFVKKGKV